MRFLPGFSLRPAPLSPSFAAGERGVRVAAGPIERSALELRLPLYFSWKLSEPESAGFASVGEAIVLQLEGEGLASAAKLLDPETPERPYQPGYQRPKAPAGHPGTSFKGFVSCAVSLPPGMRGALCVHATLLWYASNALQLEL